jgi:protocatechuate 3,4-dioxygenase alpha subunit
MGTRGQTPSQTLGPYFSMILAHDDDGEDMAPAGTPGERVVLTGRVLDGERNPVEDALVEAWQANAAGRYRHPLDDRDDVPLDDGFTGFGRSKTRFEDGTWTLRTVKPGPVPGPDGRPQAPHVNLVVQARGMLDPSFTRLYFDDEAEANADDQVLAQVPANRRATLVAVRDDGGPVPTYRLDIVFQGDDETVFLDF